MNECLPITSSVGIGGDGELTCANIGSQRQKQEHVKARSLIDRNNTSVCRVPPVPSIWGPGSEPPNPHCLSHKITLPSHILTPR